VIADRYLCDFDVELSIRFQKEQRLAMLLRRALEALAPKSRRTYLMCLDPALPRHRKPASDCRNLDPADLQARYDALVGRYGLRVYDASVPLEELASALVHDARCLEHLHVDLWAALEEPVLRQSRAVESACAAVTAHEAWTRPRQNTLNREDSVTL
jgi:hypothetical protein